jgi:hypothetical protein
MHPPWLNFPSYLLTMLYKAQYDCLLLIPVVFYYKLNHPMSHVSVYVWLKMAKLIGLTSLTGIIITAISINCQLCSMTIVKLLLPAMFRYNACGIVCLSSVTPKCKFITSSLSIHVSSHDSLGSIQLLW